MKLWIVYEHISPSNKIYVGITSAKYPCQRWHRGYNYKNCKKFYNAILKYSWDNFQHNIVASNLGEQTAKNIERDLIKFYKDRGISYNITDGGDGTLGVKWTEEIRTKMYKVHFGRRNSDETKLRMSLSAKGRVHTKESYIKKATTLKSKNYHHSIEHRVLISKAMKGRTPSKKAIENSIETNSKQIFLLNSDNIICKSYKSQTEAALELKVSQWKISTYKNTYKEVIAGYRLVTKKE